MARDKKKKNEDLVGRLRSLGVRKSTAKKLAKPTGTSKKRPSGAAGKALAGLTTAVAEAQDRLVQGPQKRKASAKKGAKTRAANAEKRSRAAKKAARTRAKNR